MPRWPGKKPAPVPNGITKCAEEGVLKARANLLTKQGPGSGKVLERDDLADIFGLDMMESVGTVPKAKTGKKAAKPVKGVAKKKTAAKKVSKKKKTRVVKSK